jgi:hypothetical protein
VKSPEQAFAQPLQRLDRIRALAGERGDQRVGDREGGGGEFGRKLLRAGAKKVMSASGTSGDDAPSVKASRTAPCFLANLASSSVLRE